MAGMRSQLAAAVAVLTLLASVTAVYAQMGDPCNNPDKDYDLLQGPPTTFQGILEGRLQERFYRFKDLKPGESLNIFVQMESNTTASVSMLMLYEIRDKQYTQLASRQVIISESEPLSEEEGRFAWMHANLGDNKPTKICFKVGLFSEARPAKVSYTISIGIDRFLDTGNVEAADKFEKAASLGSVALGTPVIVSGYLSSKDLGIDYADYYMFSTSLGPGKELIATLTTSGENNYEIAILDKEGFSLRFNQTAQKGSTTLKLTNEKTGEVTYYLKISNAGGVGGGGPYTVSLEVRPTQTATTNKTTTGTATNQTQPTTQPTLDPETARTIIYGSVSGIAAVSVIATILMARRRRRVYVVEEEF
jgi:hypothetical protein